MTQYDFTPYPIDEIIARSAYVTTRAIEELAALRSSVAALTAQNAEQARKLTEAYRLLTALDWNDYDEGADAWVRANAQYAPQMSLQQAVSDAWNAVNQPPNLNQEQTQDDERIDKMLDKWETDELEESEL